MTICHGIPWYRNGADDHCPFIIEGWWLFFYPLSYLTLTPLTPLIPICTYLHVLPYKKLLHKKQL